MDLREPGLSVTPLCSASGPLPVITIIGQGVAYSEDFLLYKEMSYAPAGNPARLSALRSSTWPGKLDRYLRYILRRYSQQVAD